MKIEKIIASQTVFTQIYSVKDALPEDIGDMCSFDWVIVFIDQDDMKLTAFAQRCDNKWLIFEDCGVHSCTGEYLVDPNNITHWMRIPNIERE